MKNHLKPSLKNKIKNKKGFDQPYIKIKIFYMAEEQNQGLKMKRANGQLGIYTCNITKTKN